MQKRKFLWILVVCFLSVFLEAEDLSLSKEDLLVIQNPKGGYHLYIRAKPDIKSVLLTETTKDPDLKLDNYAYRDPNYNEINGDEKMKTIGLIGGMSWESTVTYYQIINKVIKDKLGGLHSAKCILYSVDFEEIEECQKNGDWDRSAEILGKVALSLEKAGADFIVICTNTMHKVVSGIKKYTKLPILHIAEMTAIELKKTGIKKIGLLGTKYTMQQDFYKQILIDNGIEVVIPNSKDIEIVNSVIFNELCLGKIKKESKEEYLRIIKDLSKAGAKGVILGCTEIGLLIKQENTDIPLFDTTNIHATSAALYAIEEK